MAKKRNPMPKHRKTSGFERRTDTREPRKRFILVCEGERTEPAYFKAFESPSVHVVTVGVGGGPKAVVIEALKQDKAEKSPKRYRQVWCVFDRDDTPAGDFNGAIQQANAQGLNVAYSNEAFELWYLLHFTYQDAALHRRDYCFKLNEWLGRTYEKNDRTMYTCLLDKRDEAIKRAKKLLADHLDPQNPAACNPATTVHLLVEELIAHGKK